MSAPSTSELDLSALGRAIEGRDGEAQASFYTEDAVLRVVDRENPPSRPLVVSGREAITAYITEVAGRDMIHVVQHAIQDGDRAAFGVACRYPDGTRVLCFASAEVRDGRIAAQTNMQEWDG
jgi:hypothetical protein